MRRSHERLAWHHRIGWMSAAFGVIYWIVESFMDTYVYGLGPFPERLFYPDLNELEMRLLALGLIGAFGVYAQVMFDRLRRIEERLAKMTETFLNFGPDPVANIDRLTALCGEMLGADAALYNRLDHGSLCAWGQWRWPYQCERPDRPEGHLCFDVIQQGSKGPFVVQDLPSSHYATTDPSLVRHGFKTYLGKAVQVGGKQVGSLCTVYRDGFRPTKEDFGVLGIVASAIGVEEIRHRAEGALRTSEGRLRELSAQLLAAQESERKRVAQLLHDSIGQSLSAIKFSIEETLESLDTVVPEEKLRPLQAAVPLIQEVVSEVRRIQRNLRPAMLDDLGIRATLVWFVRQFHSIYGGIEVVSEIEVQESDVPQDLKIVIFRIVQEAFNNVAKHSRASRVHLSLCRSPGRPLELIIEDDGQGFEIRDRDSTAELEGLGLSSMRERTELSGGALEIQSTRGEGTRVRASWEPNPAAHP